MTATTNGHRSGTTWHHDHGAGTKPVEDRVLLVENITGFANALEVLRSYEWFSTETLTFVRELYRTLVVVAGRNNSGQVRYFQDLILYKYGYDLAERGASILSPKGKITRGVPYGFRRTPFEWDYSIPDYVSSSVANFLYHTKAADRSIPDELHIAREQPGPCPLVLAQYGRFYVEVAQW